MKLAFLFGLASMCLVAKAQVACTMPNGRTITLNLTHTCPAGATGAKSLDGQPVQISTPASASADLEPSRPTKSQSAEVRREPSAPVAMRGEPSHIVSRASSAGCISREAYEQLTKIAVQGDSAAFSKALAGSIVTGQCMVFKRGEVVFIDDTAVFSGLIRLRPEGQVRAYWTAMETISTK